MSTIDNGLIGSVINALPLDRMIAGPLQAMIQAQTAASKSYADFLLGVCIKDGKAVAVKFDYDETITDENGTYKGTVAKSMQIPLLAAVTHPNIAISEGTVEFELTISQAAEEATETQKGGEMAASLGWGPFKMAVKGQMSHKSTQTRKTDTRARYAFNTKVVRLDPPEALMRVMDALTEAAAKPVRLGTSALNSEESKYGNTALALQTTEAEKNAV
ncbi:MULTISPECIES: DUF2589 domain-containing protein [Pseudomonas]|uniref:DUF2589 domain-containing protein n=1 Tax=Pseudomonas quercus TaxID=2722792 RepID=A0ABX0Y7Z0_9PSED|nr:MULTISPECIES: DUF2589 domain-containing protein [Pseudomonas]MBF7140895.1 DUF2589 domain-containing protein [Pseudomonas sp. LY10J]NJO99429.1 DUF2589 domain-containing protein [Pseudomonas quercus]